VGGKEVFEGVPIPTTVQPSSSAAVKRRQYSLKLNYIKILKNYFLTKESLKDVYSGKVHIILNTFFVM
jgi:hypothetical protein